MWPADDNPALIGLLAYDERDGILTRYELIEDTSFLPAPIGDPGATPSVRTRNVARAVNRRDGVGRGYDAMHLLEAGGRRLVMLLKGGRGGGGELWAIDGETNIDPVGPGRFRFERLNPAREDLRHVFGRESLSALDRTGAENLIGGNLEIRETAAPDLGRRRGVGFHEEDVTDVAAWTIGGETFLWTGNGKDGTVMGIPLDERGKPMERWTPGQELDKWRVMCVYQAPPTTIAVWGDPTNPAALPGVRSFDGGHFALLRNRSSRTVRRHAVTPTGIDPTALETWPDFRAWDAMRVLPYSDHSTFIAFINRRSTTEILLRRVARNGTLADLNAGWTLRFGKFRDIVALESDGIRYVLLIGAIPAVLFRLEDDSTGDPVLIPESIDIPASFTEPDDETDDDEDEEAYVPADYHPFMALQPWTAAVRLTPERIGLYGRPRGRLAITTLNGLRNHTTIGVIDVGKGWRAFGSFESRDGTPLFIMGKNGWNWV